MNKKQLRVLSIGAILGSIMQIGMPISAEAAIDSYIIQLSGEIYSSNKDQLVDDFLNYKLGNKAELYNDFLIKLKMANGIYAFHDNTKGYVKYEDVQEGYSKAKISKKKFNVDEYIQRKENKVVEVNWTKKAILTSEGKVIYVTRDSNNKEVNSDESKTVINKNDNEKDNTPKLDEGNGNNHNYTKTHKKIVSFKSTSDIEEAEKQAQLKKEQEAKEAKEKADALSKKQQQEEKISEALKQDKSVELKKSEEIDIAIKEAIKQLKETFEIIIPHSEYKKYDFKKYNNLMTELGGNDYGKPSFSTGGSSVNGNAKMTIKFNYMRSVNEVRKQKDAVQAKVKKIVKEVIKPGMTDVEKELALHDYVVKHADYNMAGLNKDPIDLEDHTAYGVLVLNKGVCESYAKAMHLLLNEVGIESKYATGFKKNIDGTKGGGHAWNMVKLENEWYNLDATWDDPVSDRGGRSEKEAIVSPVIHTYFNVTDTVFNKDHIRGDFEQTNYPLANGIKYSYDNLDIDEFMNDGTKVPKVTSRDELIAVVKDAMKNKKTKLYVKLKGFSMSQQDLMNILGKILDGNVYKSYGVNPTDSSHVYCNFILR